MRFRNPSGYLVLVLVLVCLPATQASAQPVDDGTRSAARDLGMAGVEAYQDANYAGAAEKLDKAYRTLRAPSLGLWSARALAKLGKLVEASERYLEVTRLEVSSGDVAVQKRAQEEAAAEREALVARIPSIVVALDAADASKAKVLLDGMAMPSTLIGERRPVNPGRHVLEARMGDQRASADVVLAEGEHKRVLLEFRGSRPSAGAPDGAERSVATPSDSTGSAALPDSGASPASGRRTLGFIALGAGAAGLVVGGVTGVIVLGKQSEIEESEQCRDYHCLAGMTDTVDSYNSFRTVSTISFIAGGALVAAGGIVLLTLPKSGNVSLHVGPDSAYLSGRFQ